MMNRRQRLRGVLALCGALGLCAGFGCGHSQPAAPPPATASVEPPPTADSALAPAEPQAAAPVTQADSPPAPHAGGEQGSDTGRAGDETEAPVAQAGASELPTAPGEPIEAFMLEHFLITAWVRDSIVDGNLEAIRTPLEALADYAYKTVAPGGWMRGIAQLQAAARLTAQAQTLDAAASGLAAMARICGQCHREQGGPEVQYYKPERRSPKSDRLDVRMYRHAWAAERLWEGLTAPSDNAWRAGASALEHAPVAPPKTRPALPQAVVDGLAHVRDLGLRAANAETPEERANIYGALLSTCAQCHQHEAQIEF